MYGYGAWGAWGAVFAGIVVLLFCGGIAALLVVLLRDPRHHGAPGRPPLLGDDPERILAQRFARGEIDEVEYKARLEVLKHGT
ncbi:MAG TPA: SHOCT domain-containing protein [Microbacterium sp.]|uniref:SHOCT domain-containing protein n=1 Tax=Microbacterium sp. TaxID=51671 RepID=UPI002B491968|nr:SHOCT domain-containing protein [Microbacterium sp.]HKT57871.1 SHOCT domain-containing protein [Microbacterium sp.]